MVRRLVETLIIECFETYGIADRIKDQNGDFLMLGDLIKRFLDESCWHHSRNVKSSLPKLADLKNAGDTAAHSRRYLTNRQDIDRLQSHLRLCIQELVFIAGSAPATSSRQVS